MDRDDSIPDVIKARWEKWDKSRVTPLKPVTVPCLELQAAVTATKVSQQIQKELSLCNVQEFFWYDN